MKKPSLLYKSFPMDVPQRCTRSGATLTCTCKNTTMFSFAGRAVHLWNILPAELKAIEKKHIFKKHLETWIRNNVTLSIV